MTVTRTPNRDVYSKRGIFFSPAAHRRRIGPKWKGLGTEGFKTKEEDEVRKYFAKLQKGKLSRTHG